MVSTSAEASVYVYTVGSNLYSSTTHIYWGPKVWTLLISIHKYSWGLFLLWFNCLVQRVQIICCAGLLLACLSSGTLLILIGFDISSLLGLTVMFVQMLTWDSGRSLSSTPNIGLTRICLEYLFISSNRSGRSDGGLSSFCQHLDGLIFENVELLVKLYRITC